MRTLWRAITRTLFWSYERGSWPYDVMVVAILIFVLLTPRRWFNDQPSSGAVANVSAGIALQTVLSEGSGETRVYRVDASLLPADKRTTRSTPELEKETHEILRRTVDELKGRTFQISRIEPALDAKTATVAYYDVSVKP